MADCPRPLPPPLLPNQGTLWTSRKKGVMPNTMKSMSIEEELLDDYLEAPPDQDAEMGFFEVPRLQSGSSSATTQVNSATVFAPPRRDLFGSKTATSGAVRPPSTSSSSSSQSARVNSNSAASFAERFSQWPRSPNGRPASRSKPPSSSSAPKVPGSRTSLNPYGNSFPQTLPPPTPTSNQASHSSSHLSSQAGWSNQSTTSIDSRLSTYSTYSDPGAYHYYNPSVTSLSSVASASSSTSSLELPRMRLSTYSIPERTSSMSSPWSDADSNAPSTPRKRPSSSLYEGVESSSRSIRSVASTDDRYGGGSSSSRRDSSHSDADGLPIGWSGPENGESSSSSDVDARWAMRGDDARSVHSERSLRLSQEPDEGDRTYSLQVVQEPQTACAIGFEDEEENPLSPTPILKLTVYDALQRPVDPKTIDLHQFVVSVDLWSPDASHEMNLLVTPAGVVPRQGRPPVKRAESVSPSSRPLSPDPAPDISRERTPQPQARPPPESPPMLQGWSQEAEVRVQQQPSPPQQDWSNAKLSGIASFSRNGSLSSAPAFPPSKDLSLSIPPSLSSAWDRRDSTSSTISSWSSTDPISARQSFDSRWSGDPRRQSDAFRRSGLGAEIFPPMATDETPPSSTATSSYALPIEALAGIRLSSPSISHNPPPVFSAPTPTRKPSIPIFAPTGGSIPTFAATGGAFSMASRTLPPLPPPPVAGKYSRALVGSLVTVAHRLVDEQGQTGVFFFANEISIRTEGSYRLRFCLMKVDSSTRIAPSLILAETFSSPIVVHSAANFPGPLPPSRLSQTFISQGVKLSPSSSRRQISNGIQDSMVRSTANGRPF